MSYIGKNIKKIRTAKRLSQAAFADIFDITRGSIGAYEEGRAEPKIDTIIQIANYFGISIDLLLNKELSVNELYSFDILTQKLNKAHEFVSKQEPTYRKGGIGLVKTSHYVEYIVNCTNRDFLSHLPYIELPVNFKGITRAFELNGSEMEYHQNGLHHNDILLCLLWDNSKPTPGNVFVIVHQDGILTKRLQSCNNNTLNFVSDDPNYAPIELTLKDIKELWLVKGVYSTYLNPPKLIDEKVMLLEKRQEELEKRILKFEKKK
ncbi:LexA family transcriptional regulator [Fulvivirga sp. 29W222]|uniref:LexA family transcriptional regulator n=1 Tax=Fulvivirga marina TaxID=2494733 RepID=A0A937FVX9_9BACT|nr:LexA family transcriptional regulator [Fulvivirga marina]MBL6447115.1 LexA family transcriptional regulator [Fulvivirga marina]